MLERFERYIAQLRLKLWQSEAQQLPLWRHVFARAALIAYAVVRDLIEGQLTLRAMSLVYSSLLSLAPLIAVSFSVLKAFGVHNQLEPAIQNMLEPLGNKGVEITTNIVNFVENIQVGVLGSMGLALLFYTVVSLMQKVETSFNYTWRVTQSRNFAQRFSDYLSVLMIGPVLVFAALGVTGSMLNNSVVQRLSEIGPLGSAVHLATTLLPYLLIIAAFTFIYSFIPNTKVHFKAALAGGVVSGILWETLGWVFASFVVTSANYTAIYSAFASLMFFLIWLYLGWLVLLTGASIAFYVQHPDYALTPRGQLNLSLDQREKIALAIMLKITKDFYAGNAMSTAGELSVVLNVSEDIMLQVLDTLEQGQLLTQSNDDHPKYLPASPVENMTVKTVLDAVRYAYENNELHRRQVRLEPEIEKVFASVDTNLSQLLGATTLKQLVTEDNKADDDT
ncbi:YihY/virulence factor BrkB family protein [Candidatus Nitrotoga sp. M5]|uniref:YihY/virulence factor BrkB family protein n=1 Tax=Candidatus Nitrotoga sp. M5 TaxID=2890409 RepID=UPI001EF2DDC2|nr:YihY/virulence factor BrkB family protein [Candidatus Nitrotoga sp. M5]CAH1386397.1 Ribonuclease BN [Candidatus Nitrotoga sp. M5]